MRQPARTLPVLVVALFPACGIGVVRVEGRVGDGPGTEIVPLADARVEILDDDGFSFATVTTDELGEFRTEAPPGETIYAGVTHPDGITTGFTGTSGLEPVLTVGDGNLYGVSAALRDAWLAPFAGCPGVEAGGSMAIGVVHVFLPGVDPDPSTIVTTATVGLADPQSGEPLDLEACYLDPETGLWSPDQEETGALGWYLIAGAEEGKKVLQVEFAITDEAFERAFIDVWMPPDGMVPRFPTFVEFPPI